jgi:uncharacterized membrane protein YeaQ/YmgE (transglycosylase-associated protein family)
VILAVFVALVVLFVVLPLVGVALWWLISTAVVGLIVGAIGRLVVPGRTPIGILPTIACGLAGALIGGAIGRALGGWFVTIIVEIAVAAVAVFAWDVTHRRSLSGSSSGAITRGSRW